MKDISCYQIKFLVSRAYSVAIRLFAHEGQIKTPKMLSDNIGDRQNVSCLGIVKKGFDFFFSNYVPSVLTFSRLSGIYCTKLFFEIRPVFRNMTRAYSNFGPYIVP